MGKFDEAAFDALAVDGMITKDDFLQAAGEAGGTDSNPPPSENALQVVSSHAPSQTSQTSTHGNTLPPRYVVLRVCKLCRKIFEKADLAAKAANRDEEKAEKLRI